MDHRGCVRLGLLALLCLLPAPVSGRRPERGRRVRPSSVHPPRAGETVAGRFLSRRHMARGPRASGEVGDYFVRSARLLAVVSADDGVLIDLALAPGFIDGFGRCATAVCDSRGRHAVSVDRVTILTRRRDRRAGLRLQGEVRHGQDRLQVSTVFHIPDGAEHLEVTTTVVNRGRRVWHNVGVCDHLWTGNTPLQVPGTGEVKQPGVHRARFCARSENGESMLLGVPPDATPMQLSLGFAHPAPAFDPAIDAGYGRASLGPSTQLVVRRVLVLARGGVHRALAAALRATGQPTRTVAVKLPVPGRVVVRRKEQTYLLADGAGEQTKLVLPKGPYSVALRVPGAGDGPVVQLPAGMESVTPRPPELGRLRLQVKVDGKAAPVKVMLHGVGKTPDPDFGRGQSLRVENVVYSAAGDERVSLAPGRYRVTATRGPEHSLASRAVTVTAGRETKTTLSLRRLLDPKGWVAADLHLHTRASGDSPVRTRDRLVAAAALGLDLVVLTDHNAVTKGAADGVIGAPLVVSGQEVTTTTNMFGHFNVFPLAAPLRWDDTTPGQLFSAARRRGKDVLIQVNHPLMERIGYFDQMGFDPRRGVARSPGYDHRFDLLEVFNGDHLDRPRELNRVVQDWLALLAGGRTYVATGGSDSHRLPYMEAGYPRTYVRVDGVSSGASRASILAALRGGRAVVSTGPRVSVTLAGKGIGSRVERGDSASLPLEIRVEAPPWIDVRRVELWESGKRIRSFDVGGRASPVRFARKLRVTPRAGSWYVVMVRGDRADPTIPWREVRTFAVTNPVWVGP